MSKRPHVAFDPEDMSAIEYATSILYGYLVADTKLSEAVQAIRILQIGAPVPLDTDKIPAIYIQPSILTPSPRPGFWGSEVLVEVTLRTDFSYIKGGKRTAEIEPWTVGVATLLSYITTVALGEGARQLSYTPTGETQSRPLTTRVDVESLEFQPVGSNNEVAIVDFVIGLKYNINLRSDVKTPRAQPVS